MKKGLKLTLVLVACLCVFITSSGCISSDFLSVTEETDGKWLISDLDGVIVETTEVSPNDDFHAAINKDWILATDISNKPKNVPVSANDSMGEENQSRALASISDEDIVSSDDEKMTALYNELLDMDTRNSIGFTPIKEGVDKILAIQSLDELKTYLKDNEDTAFLSLEVISDPVNDGYMVLIQQPLYSLFPLEAYDDISFEGRKVIPMEADRSFKFYETMGKEVGIPSEKLMKMYLAQLGVEKILASAQSFDELQTADSKTMIDFINDLNNPVSVEEIKAKTFPVAEIVRDFLDAGITKYSVAYPKLYETLDSVYTEENLEGLKSMLLYGYFMKYAMFLNETAYDAYHELTGVGNETFDEETALYFIEDLSPAGISKVYVDYYVPPTMKSDVDWIIEHYVEAYRKLLENTTWASETLKEQAISKLDHLQWSAAYPDWTIYQLDKLEISGTDLLGDVKRCDQSRLDYNVRLAGMPKDCPDAWISSDFLVYTVNAGNEPLKNSIFFPAGILGGTYYDLNAGYEKNLAGIGFTIGHELSHSFDTVGANFREDGTLSNWWTDEDNEEFSKRTDRVIDYLSSFELFGQPVDGELVVSEAIADITGMDVTLQVATVLPEFNYNDFFTAYAKKWATKESFAALMALLAADEHPLNYLRTNVVLQQFEPFYSEYGITEMDGMYLAPEDRLKVW